jgi:four helix bundle protein
MKSKLINDSKQFAIDIVNACNGKEINRNNVLISQLLRSGTSIGANVHEANYAASKADFINKLQIALKECYETEYWLDLFKATKIIPLDICDKLMTECGKLRFLLIKSITTAKEANQ